MISSYTFVQIAWPLTSNGKETTSNN